MGERLPRASQAIILLGLVGEDARSYSLSLDNNVERLDSDRVFSPLFPMVRVLCAE